MYYKNEQKKNFNTVNCDSNTLSGWTVSYVVTTIDSHKQQVGMAESTGERGRHTPNLAKAQTI